MEYRRHCSTRKYFEIEFVPQNLYNNTNYWNQRLLISDPWVNDDEYYENFAKQAQPGFNPKVDQKGSLLLLGLGKNPFALMT